MSDCTKEKPCKTTFGGSGITEYVCGKHQALRDQRKIWDETEPSEWALDRAVVVADLGGDIDCSTAAHLLDAARAEGRREEREACAVQAEFYSLACAASIRARGKP